MIGRDVLIVEFSSSGDDGLCLNLVAPVSVDSASAEDRTYRHLPFTFVTAAAIRDSQVTEEIVSRYLVRLYR
jgi:hypothetical protein